MKAVEPKAVWSTVHLFFVQVLCCLSVCYCLMRGGSRMLLPSATVPCCGLFWGCCVEPAGTCNSGWCPVIRAVIGWCVYVRLVYYVACLCSYIVLQAPCCAILCLETGLRCTLQLVPPLLLKQKLARVLLTGVLGVGTGVL